MPTISPLLPTIVGHYRKFIFCIINHTRRGTTLSSFFNIFRSWSANSVSSSNNSALSPVAPPPPPNQPPPSTTHNNNNNNNNSPSSESKVSAVVPAIASPITGLRPLAQFVFRFLFVFLGKAMNFIKEMIFSSIPPSNSFVSVLNP